MKSCLRYRTQFLASLIKNSHAVIRVPFLHLLSNINQMYAEGNVVETFYYIRIGPVKREIGDDGTMDYSKGGNRCQDATQLTAQPYLAINIPTLGLIKFAF